MTGGSPDLVVVGAGLSGAVVAERAARLLSWKVLVIEQRDHIGGNAADTFDEHGVRVHRYGPHVFHTNSDAVWRYLSRFTRWLAYEHRVMATVEGSFVPLPINLESIDRLLPSAKALELRKALLASYGRDTEVPILRMRTSDNPVIRNFSERLYEEVYLGYTIKQWGRRPEELDASVTARVPVRLNRDSRYFTDRYQAIPEHGYTTMVASMLSHRNIEVRLGTDYHQENLCRCRRLLYTGPVDRYFDYCHGELPYRTMRFDFRYDARDRVQPTASVTYPGSATYTRSCEYKQLTGQQVRGSTISFEFPGEHRPGETIPYYPMPLPESRTQYRRYAADAARARRVVFCGRLGRYQYLNMDQAVAQALRAVEYLAALM